MTFNGVHELDAWTLDYKLAYGRAELDEPNREWLFRSAGMAGGSLNATAVL